MDLSPNGFSNNTVPKFCTPNLKTLYVDLRFTPLLATVVLGEKALISRS